MGGEGLDVHVCGEGVEGLVEVVHLHQDADRHGDAEDVRAWVIELVVPGEREFHGYAEPFDGHYRDRADEGAYGDVYGGICPAVLGHHEVNHDERKDEDRETIHHKP